MQKLNDEVELYKSGKYKFQDDKLFKKGNFEAIRHGKAIRIPRQSFEDWLRERR